MARSGTAGKEQVIAAFRQTGSITATARALGCTRSTVQYHLGRTGLNKKPLHGGKRGSSIKEVTRDLPSRGVKRYILTCAQSNTKLHDVVWDNVLALRAYYKAELLISRFAYNISAYLRRTGPTVKPTTIVVEEELWYDPRIQPYICDERHELAPGLVFCGELNILPTAARPLSGFETYTGRKSAIVPHVKLAMESIASVGDDATKFNYTTGTVTQMNYLQKKAGQKAEFHHSYGALLVEVTPDGEWFVRQLNADSRGRIYDVGDRDDGAILAEDGAVTSGHNVEAINWGDIHEWELDPEVRRVSWSEGGMLDVLRPRFQLGNDTFSFTSRNHHDRGDPHRNFEKHVQGRDSVRGELGSLVKFLNEEAHRDWCKFVVVESNHDNALGRWLKEADYKSDPLNARIFLELQARKYQAIEEQDKNFHLLEHALRAQGLRKDVRFLREDEKFVICRDSGGGIECSIHGHMGVNGVKGSPLGLSKMGRRANTGHTHSAGIIDGLYTAGTCSRLRVGFNRGPSSWSHSDIVTYANGKRCIVTKWRGKWRAA